MSLLETPEQRRSREAMERRWDKAEATPTPAPSPPASRACPHLKRKVYEKGKCRECFAAPFFVESYSVVEIMDLTGFTYPAVMHRLKQMGITPKTEKTEKKQTREQRRPLSKRAYQMPMPNYVSPTRRDGGVKKSVFAPVASAPTRKLPHRLYEEDDF